MQSSAPPPTAAPGPAPSAKRAVLATLLALLGVFAVGGAGAFVLFRSKAPARLTKAERAPLVVVDEGGQRWLRHPAFDFAILHPGPGFRESTEVVTAMGAGDPETQTYGFMETETSSVVIVSVMKGMGGSEAALKAHLDGVLTGVQRSLAGQPGVRTLTNEVVWDASGHVGRLSVAVGGVARIDVAAYSVTRTGKAPFIVNLTVTAPPSDRFAGLLASFRS